MGNVTSQALPGFCLATISKARSMLSACTITLKRAAPLLTSTEILTISPTPSFRVKLAMIVTYRLYFTIFTVGSETKSERENLGDLARRQCRAYRWARLWRERWTRRWANPDL
jgi:hypothetical protein